MLFRSDSGWAPEVLTYSGYYNLGIEEIWDMIDRYIQFVKDNGFFYKKRNEQAKYRMFETINEDLRNNFYNNPEIASLLVKLEDDILHTRKSSYAAAKEALAKYYDLQNRM